MSMFLNILVYICNLKYYNEWTDSFKTKYKVYFKLTIKCIYLKLTKAIIIPDIYVYYT